MVISAPIFEAYLKCPSKCWFLFLDKESDSNIYSNFIKNQNNAYRIAAIERLMTKIQPSEYVVKPSIPLNIKTATWLWAIDIVAINDIIESRLHAVERMPPGCKGKQIQFIPIRFIFTNKLTKDDKLILAFDALALSKMLGREVSHGKIIHGISHSAVKVKTSLLTGEVRKLIGKIEKLVANESPPDIILNRHCAECEYQIWCRQMAIEKDDLSLLAGMSEKERKKFNSKGIFTVTQLSCTFRPRRRPKQMRDKREKYHHSLCKEVWIARHQAFNGQYLSASGCADGDNSKNPEAQEPDHNGTVHQRTRTGQAGAGNLVKKKFTTKFHDHESIPYNERIPGSVTT